MQNIDVPVRSLSVEERNLWSHRDPLAKDRQENKTPRCPMCGKKFPCWNDLVKHRGGVLIISADKIQCDKCGLQFINSQGYANHLAVSPKCVDWAVEQDHLIAVDSDNHLIIRGTLHMLQSESKYVLYGITPTGEMRTCLRVDKAKTARGILKSQCGQDQPIMKLSTWYHECFEGDTIQVESVTLEIVKMKNHKLTLAVKAPSEQRIVVKKRNRH